MNNIQISDSSKAGIAAKLLIFIGLAPFAIWIWGFQLIPHLYWRLKGEMIFPIIPHWLDTYGLIGVVFFWLGTFFGSRGIGKPLTVVLFFKLLFAFPCVVPFSLYISGFILYSFLELVK